MSARKLLEEINQWLPGLEAAVCPAAAVLKVFDAIGGHINKVVVPAAAVLKVFDAILGLEKSLSDPQSDVHSC
ncbi:putative exocyst complex component Exo70 [Helianthus anomalus]